MLALIRAKLISNALRYSALKCSRLQERRWRGARWSFRRWQYFRWNGGAEMNRAKAGTLMQHAAWRQELGKIIATITASICTQGSKSLRLRCLRGLFPLLGYHHDLNFIFLPTNWKQYLQPMKHKTQSYFSVVYTLTQNTCRELSLWCLEYCTGSPI